MTRSEIQARIRILKDELETRHKYGTVKIASPNGDPIPVENLQSELYSLIYRLSKMW
jgi:LEA14-like dessication related protein